MTYILLLINIAKMRVYIQAAKEKEPPGAGFLK